MKKCERCGVTSSGVPGCHNNIQSGSAKCNGCIVDIGFVRMEEERRERINKNKPLYIGVAIGAGVLLMFVACSACIS